MYSTNTFNMQFHQEHNLIACTLFPGIILNNQQFKLQGTATMGQFETTIDGHRVPLTWMSRLK
jgi:hypothetical protein